MRSLKQSITNYLTLIFSFFLGFGQFDPFGTNGFFFQILTVLLMLQIACFSDVLKSASKYKSELLLLFLIVLIFFFAGVIYGYSNFKLFPLNFKLILAIVIFWFLSYTFLLNKKLILYSCLAFSLSCTLIVILYSLGIVVPERDLNEGVRLILFGENPNSLSTRFTLSFIILLYITIENPLSLKKYRYVFLFALPLLFSAVLKSGSKGSFIFLLFGSGVLIMLSNIKNYVKFSLFTLGLILLIYSIPSIEESVVFWRFSNSSSLSTGRGDIWMHVLDIFFTYPFGVGEAGYLTEITKRYETIDTHNIFLYIMVCGGFISAILFLLFLIILLRKAIRALKNKSSFQIVLLCIILLMASKTGGVLTYLVMWYFFAVINSLSTSYNKYPKIVQ